MGEVLIFFQPADQTDHALFAFGAGVAGLLQYLSGQTVLQILAKIARAVEVQQRFPVQIAHGQQDEPLGGQAAVEGANLTHQGLTGLIGAGK